MSAREFAALHPALQYHVVNSLGWSSLRATQAAAIDPVLSGKDCLILAPTAGGKTEAAFIPVLSRMLSENWRGLGVLYVCPIKALLNNLEPRLAHYAGLVGRSVGLWHGDVSGSIKDRQRRDLPDVLLTTPESLEGILISRRQEQSALLGQVRTIIVDELHAFAGDDRGWHLRAVLKRLEHYSRGRPQRIGLSATVGNPAELLHWFSGAPDAEIVGEATLSKGGRLVLDFVGSVEGAATVLSRLHKGDKRLVFCDSRSKVERLAGLLREQQVKTFVSHSSLSLAERKAAEAAFSEERDCVIIATSTLELGIDVGDLDHVLQVDSPSTVSSLLQRMGRTGRRPGTERNCTFLTTSDEALLLAAAISRLLSEGYTEPVRPSAEPWHLAAPQAMAIVLERRSASREAVLAQVAAAFPELAQRKIADLLDYLVSRDILWDSEGLLWFGKRGERDFGGRNFMDLVTSFTTPPLIAVRFGAAELGFVDPVSLHSTDDSRIVLSLGGSNWQVQSVDWKRRIASVQPTKIQGRSQWLGTSRSLSCQVTETMKRVLLDGITEAQLSRRALDRLEELRGVYSFLSETATDLVQYPDGSRKWWTFAGSKANAVLAGALTRSSHLPMPRWDDLALKLDSDVIPNLTQLAASMTNAAPIDDVQGKFVEQLKFGSCLPTELLARCVQARILDRDTAARVLRAPINRGSVAAA